MPKLKIFSSVQIQSLKDNIKNNLHIYRDHGIAFEVPKEELLPTLLDVPEVLPELYMTNDARKTKDDAKNAEIIHEYLGNLSRTQASDTRLWITLTHINFMQYCKDRWPPKETNWESYIETHWFMKKGGGRASLSRNAISRLWWGAFLTVAPWEKDEGLEFMRSSDRYWLTKVLFSQAQLVQDLFEREFGSNKRLMAIFLYSISLYSKEFAGKDAELIAPNVDQLSIEASKRVLLMLKSRHIEMFAADELREAIGAITHDVASEQCAA